MSFPPIFIEGGGGQKLKNKLGQIFSPFPAIWNNFDFLVLNQQMFGPPPNFGRGGGHSSLPCYPIRVRG